MLRAFADGRVFGETYGASPPSVVALHGWARAHGDFDKLLAGLDAAAYDLPGFGASPPPPEPCGSPEYAAAVADAMAAPAVVVGHSLGGRVAVHLAASRPDLVRALVLTGAPLIRTAAARKPPLGYRVARALNRRRLLSDARMENYRQQYGLADYRNAQGVMRAVHVRIVNESYDDAIAAIRCPVELVWGDDDADAPLAVAHELERRIAGARLTVCPGAGHMTPLTAPDALRAAIERQL